MIVESAVTAVVNSYHELRFFGQKECITSTEGLFVIEFDQLFYY